MLRRTLALMAAPVLVTTMYAGDAPDRGKAETLVLDAVAFGKANGREKLIHEVNFEHGKFHTTSPNGVYLIVYDNKGKVAAHGLDSKHLQMGHLNYPELKGMADKRELFQADGIHPGVEAQTQLLDNVWEKLRPMLRPYKKGSW